MELMSTSLEKLYKTVHHRLYETIPEDIMGRIGLSVSLYACVSMLQILVIFLQ